jgi:hypothetical protein
MAYRFPLRAHDGHVGTVLVRDRFQTHKRNDPQCRSGALYSYLSRGTEKGYWNATRYTSPGTANFLGGTVPSAGTPTCACTTDLTEGSHVSSLRVGLWLVHYLSAARKGKYWLSQLGDRGSLPANPRGVGGGTLRLKSLFFLCRSERGAYVTYSTIELKQRKNKLRGH